MVAWRRTVKAIVAASGLCAVALPATAGEYVGLDPYNRPVYIHPGPVPAVPIAVAPPVYERRAGAFAGPQVAGPLYYATPAPPVPASTATIRRLPPAPSSPSTSMRRWRRPRPRAARPWWEEARGPRPSPVPGIAIARPANRSFDAETGTYQPSTGPRRLCR